MWKAFNPNPKGCRVGDCTIRALCRALNQSWEKTYMDLCVMGLTICDMPSANAVWGAYLHKKGFERKAISTECPECYTLNDFCNEFPNGTFVVALSGHVVCVENGDIYDSWDSSAEIPVYYWQKKGG